MRLVAEMLGQLSRHRPLHQPLGQLREHTARPDDLLLSPGAREQLVDHLVGKAIADRFRKLERLAAGRPLRSPSGLAPRPAGALNQIMLVFVDMTLLRFRHAYTADRTLPLVVWQRKVKATASGRCGAVGRLQPMVDAVGAAGGPARELGGGVRMPVLGLGVWQMAEGRETEQAVEWALEAGYRHIDTATMYRNERSVGAALARSGLPREEVFVTTKWLPMMRGARRELARSLERLGLEYVDLYLIHWPVPVRAGHGWAELEKLRERGLARAVGVSNYGRRPARAAGRGRAAARRSTRCCSARSTSAGRCSSSASSTGSCSRPTARSTAAARSTDPLVVEIARRLGRTPAQVLLRWSIQHGAVVIPKSSRQDRIRSNAQIFDFALGPGDMRALDALDRTGGTAGGR